MSERKDYHMIACETWCIEWIECLRKHRCIMFDFWSIRRQSILLCLVLLWDVASSVVLWCNSHKFYVAYYQHPGFAMVSVNLDLIVNRKWVTSLCVVCDFFFKVALQFNTRMTERVNLWYLCDILNNFKSFFKIFFSFCIVQ